MLSTTLPRHQVPRGLKGNLAYRANLLEAAGQSRLRQKAIWQACKDDLLFFCDAFVWQVNPKLASPERVGPWITYDFQVEAFQKMAWCLDHRKDLLIEKSRQMGASLMLDILFLHRFLFHPWQRLLFISRNEKAVEADNSNSLFWKLDFMLRYLPDWLLPDRRGKGFVRKQLYFGNDVLDSQLFGEASTGKAGVGGNMTAMGIDEFSQIQDDFEVLDRTSDAAGCRIFNGTHLGTGTAFYKLAVSGVIKKLQLHWSQHPLYSQGLYRYNTHANQIEVLDKNHVFSAGFRFVYSPAPAGGPFPGLRSPWYDEQCARKGSPRAVAMDLDIDPGGSAAQFFNALALRAIADELVVDPYWQGDLNIDADAGRPKGLSRRGGGPLALWLILEGEGNVPAAPYVAGVDVSAGSGATNSVCSVVNAATGEKVAEFASAVLRPEVFANHVAALLRLFQDEHGIPARVAWEHAGPGIPFASRLLETGITNVFYRSASPLNYGMINPDRNAKQPGWYPSVEAKRLLLEQYREALENRRFINRSKLAIAECLDYAYDGRGNPIHPHEVKAEDPTGARVNHGDRVCADSLAWMLALETGAGRREKELPPEKIPMSLAWRRAHRNRYAAGDWADELPTSFYLGAGA